MIQLAFLLFSQEVQRVDTVSIRVNKALQGITTGELAKRAGVSRGTVRRWETQCRTVSPETAERLTKALLEGNGSGPVDRIEEPLSAA